MKAIAITRRDCLDQACTKFLAACELLPVLLPNVTEAALELCDRTGIAGLVLTGGNDLAALGGDAPERDTTENALLDFAERRKLPVLGVCRGMQMIQQRFDIPLSRVGGHVTESSRPPLDVWAVSDDGVVKAIRHSAQPITGIMWHPERWAPFLPAEMDLFREIFGVE
jgi:putative glutamine amidotransferase